MLLHDRRRGRDGRDHVAAGGGDLRLREAVARAAVRRPRSGDVVAPIDGAEDVGRADADDEGVVRRRVGNAAIGSADGEVPRCGDHDDAAQPQLLDRLVERVVADAGGSRLLQREVGDADPVRGPVLVDPVDGGDDVARHRHAVVVHHVERDDPRVRSRARVARTAAGRDVGDERPVATAVARRVRRQRRERDLLDDAVAEVGPRGVDPGVDDRDRGRVRVVGRRRRPELVDAERVRPHLGVRVRDVRLRCGRRARRAARAGRGDDDAEPAAGVGRLRRVDGVGRGGDVGARSGRVAPLPLVRVRERPGPRPRAGGSAELTTGCSRSGDRGPRGGAGRRCGDGAGRRGRGERGSAVSGGRDDDPHGSADQPGADGERGVGRAREVGAACRVVVDPRGRQRMVVDGDVVQRAAEAVAAATVVAEEKVACRIPRGARERPRPDQRPVEVEAQRRSVPRPDQVMPLAHRRADGRGEVVLRRRRDDERVVPGAVDPQERAPVLRVAPLADDACVHLGTVGLDPRLEREAVREGVVRKPGDVEGAGRAVELQGAGVAGDARRGGRCRADVGPGEPVPRAVGRRRALVGELPEAERRGHRDRRSTVTGAAALPSVRVARRTGPRSGRCGERPAVLGGARDGRRRGRRRRLGRRRRGRRRGRRRRRLRRRSRQGGDDQRGSRDDRGRTVGVGSRDGDAKGRAGVGVRRGVGRSGRAGDVVAGESRRVAPLPLVRERDGPVAGPRPGFDAERAADLRDARQRDCRRRRRPARRGQRNVRGDREHAGARRQEKDLLTGQLRGDARDRDETALEPLGLPWIRRDRRGDVAGGVAAVPAGPRLDDDAEARVGRRLRGGEERVRQVCADRRSTPCREGHEGGDNDRDDGRSRHAPIATRVARATPYLHCRFLPDCPGPRLRGRPQPRRCRSKLGRGCAHAY